jgi:hypothetical protein
MPCSTAVWVEHGFFACAILRRWVPWGKWKNIVLGQAGRKLQFSDVIIDADGFSGELASVRRGPSACIHFGLL